MSEWTIWKDGTSLGTFAALGLEGLTRTRISQEPDLVTFSAPTDAYDGTALFSFGDVLVIKKDGVNFFYGRVVTNPRLGSEAEERISYQLEGPWHWLAHTNYLQSWKIFEGEALTNKNKSRMILNQEYPSGDRITSGAQIEDAINYAISVGAPITLGTIDGGFNLPFDEQIDLTCAEVIHKMLRWSPDVIFSFDYTTDPYPTLNARSRTDQTSKSYDANGGIIVNSIKITERNDLQIPGVVIYYEHSDDIDGVVYETITEDTAGTTDAFDTLHTTVELAGARVVHVTQRIETEAWPENGGEEDLNDKAFWKAKLPALGNIADVDLTIEDGARTGVLPRILTEGVIQDWMSTIDREDDVVSAKIGYKIRDAEGDVVKEVIDKEVSVRFTSTSGVTRTYSRLSECEEGEPTPVGVAASLYAAWSVLQYQGILVLQEEEVAANVGPGQKLNLTNGLAAWSTMNAMIQSVTEDVDNGQTTIQFGPAEQLGPADLVSLLRTFRTRRPAWKYITRGSGSSTDQGDTELSGPVPKLEGSEIQGQDQVSVMSQTTGGKTQKINLDPASITETDTDVVIQARQISLPELDGDDLNIKAREVMASESFGDSTLLASLMNLRELKDTNLSTISDQQGVKWDNATSMFVKTDLGGNASNPGTSIDTLGAGTEGSDTALTDTWTAGDTNGLALWFVARVVYLDATSEILYAFLRKATFDNSGKLYSVSAETPITVDVPVAES